MFNTNKPKKNYDTLTQTLLKKMSEKDREFKEKVIQQEMDSDEIAEIISKRLLKLIEEKISIQ